MQIVKDKLVTVRPDRETMTRHSVPQFVGISAATAGSTGISMNMVIIPPGGSAQPHIHVGHETAIFVLSGHVRTYYGPGLEQFVENEAGDFIYIAADCLHQPVNLSQTEAVRAIVARNDADEQEHVLVDNTGPRRG